jgi:hypothetical protein
MKTCLECNIEKEFNQFFKSTIKKDGFKNKCKDCCKIYQKKYRENNQEKVKKYCQNNKEYHKNYQKNRYLNNNEYYKEYYTNNKEIIKNKKQESSYNEYQREYQREYYKNNKKKLIDYSKKYFTYKRNNDNLFKLSCNLRILISQVIKKSKYKKNNKTELILGCTYEEFKIYLESKFESWMSWDNYGNPKDGLLELNKTWDIDHIIPVSSAKTEEEIIKLNHYTNLQPLCSKVNREIKKNNYLK